MYEINSLATIIFLKFVKYNTDKLYSIVKTEKGKKYLINFFKKKKRIINSLILVVNFYSILIFENIKDLFKTFKRNKILKNILILTKFYKNNF